MKQTFRKQTNQKEQWLQYKSNKNDVIAESKDSVLIEVHDYKDNKFIFWFNKEYIWFSNYSNILTLRAPADWQLKDINTDEIYKFEDFIADFSDNEDDVLDEDLTKKPSKRSK